MQTENNHKSVEELIIAFLRKELSENEKEILKQWISSADSNRTYFKQICSIWKAAAISDLKRTEGTNSAFEKIKLRAFKEASAKSKTGFFTRFDPRFFQWAAAIAITIFIGSLLHYLFVIEAPSQEVQNIISVPLGSKSEVALPDGSKVWLNAGSKLSYGMNYGKQLREVNLIGEGYFKVAKNANKPFIVHASKMNIKALGTEFNVKAYPDENVMETVLVKGSVMVSKTSNGEKAFDPENKKCVLLKPGQKVQFLKDTNPFKNTFPAKSSPNSTVLNRKNTEEKTEITLQSTDTQVETSWKDKRWIIKAENLDDLAVLLARRFDKTIIIVDQELSQYRFSGTIENETMEQVFDIMSLTVPILYSIEKGEVRIELNRNVEKKFKTAYTK
jgi:transmembrane sensor